MFKKLHAAMEAAGFTRQIERIKEWFEFELPTTEYLGKGGSRRGGVAAGKRDGEISAREVQRYSVGLRSLTVGQLSKDRGRLTH